MADSSLDVARDTTDNNDADGEIAREWDGDARGDGAAGLSHLSVSFIWLCIAQRCFGHRCEHADFAWTSAP